MRNLRDRIRRLTLTQAGGFLDSIGAVDRNVVLRPPQGRDVLSAERFIARYGFNTVVSALRTPIMFVGGPTGARVFSGRFETFLLDRAFSTWVLYGAQTVLLAMNEAEATRPLIQVPVRVRV